MARTSLPGIGSRIRSRVGLRLGLLAPLVLLAACRGGISEKPPVHLVDDMDFQPKLKAQSESGFAYWADGRGMRQPVPGTIARGHLPSGAAASVVGSF